MSREKELFREFCMTKSRLPIFMHSWWLDCVAGKNKWDVAIVLNKNNIMACFPYIIKKKGIWQAIGMPELTPFLGIWIDYPEGLNENDRISLEKKTINRLIDQLPKHDKFFMRFDHTFTNWLPFYWKGFKETTCYTYVIENMTDLLTVFKNIQPNIRSDINKAGEKIHVKNSDDVKKLYKLCTLTFLRQGLKTPFTCDMIKRIYSAVRENHCGQIFFAEDLQGNCHAGAMLVWDQNRAYYLLGGGDPVLRNSGATSLLIWETIRFAAKVTDKFDFEGSMIEPLEKFFRAFGAIQKPYYLITKTNSKLIGAIRLIKDLLINKSN